MATERQLWALALKVERDHGDDGPRYIAERIGEAALAGEQAGIDCGKLLPCDSTN
ncbi:MAG: hypothetical protein OSB00_08635 [Sphingomonas bacterium]|nr:hypothetical protein [Sphingomonas bacterium]